MFYAPSASANRHELQKNTKVRRQEQVWRRGEPTENDLKFQRQINKFPWEAKLKGNGEKKLRGVGDSFKKWIKSSWARKMWRKGKCE